MFKPRINKNSEKLVIKRKEEKKNFAFCSFGDEKHQSENVVPSARETTQITNVTKEVHRPVNYMRLN